MGFFKKITRPIRKIAKKIIPKEVKPFLPYIAAFYGGPAMAGSNFMTSGIGNQFLRNAVSKGLIAGATAGATDEDANILRTAALAGAPDLLSGGLGSAGRALGNANPESKLAQFLVSKGTGLEATLNNPGIMDAAKIVGTQTAVDASAKLAEINQEEIDKYNASLLSQGMQNKGDRRTAIFNIFKNAGYDDNYVNTMLDTYGYANGGRAGYRYGTMVKTKAPPSAASDNGIMEVIKVDAEVDKDGDKEEMSMEEFIEMMKGGGDDNDIEDSLDYAQQGLGMLQGNVKSMPMMRFADGGDVEIDFGGIREAVENSPMSNERVVQMYVSDSAGVIPLADGDAVKGKTMDMMAIGAIEPYGKDDFRDPDGYERFIDIFTEFKNRNDQKNKELNSEGMKKGGKVKKKRKHNDNIDDEDIGEGVSKERFLRVMPEADGIPRSDGIIELAEGGLMNLGGREMDMRKGGFIPIGKKERADDVPARLSKNEFVMTANAVRAAGGGSVNKGAKKMYNLMNNLEART